MSNTTSPSSLLNGITSNWTKSTNCTVTNRSLHYAQMTVEMVSAVVHVFLCISLIIYRRKLRQNLVNLYAANVVFANICFSILSTTVAFLNYFGYSRDAEARHSVNHPIYYFWYLLNISVLTMFVVACGGICLLVLEMKKNLFRVHRSVAGLSRNSVQTIKNVDLAVCSKKKKVRYRILRWIQKNPRSFAKFQIIILWIVPVLVSLASFYNSSYCIRECECILNLVPTDTFPNCPFEKGCNNLFPGFNNVTLIASGGVCFFSISVLLVLLLISYVNFRQVMMKRQSAKDKQLRDSVIEKQKKEANEVSVEEKSSIDDHSAISPNTLQRSKLETGTLERSGRFSRRAYSKSLFSESLKKHILFLVLVAGIFIFGTTPTMTVAFISAINPYVLDSLAVDGAMIPFITLPTLTSLTNSILLCSAYSGLNIALRSTVRSIAGCRCFKRRR